MKPKHANGKPDTRYTVTLEGTGHPQTQHVARWCGERIDAADNRRDAWAICTSHQYNRAQALEVQA